MGTLFKTILFFIFLGSLPAQAGESGAIPGADVHELLAWAQAHNPELAGVQHEAEAAAERVDASGALPDPAFRMSLQDFTNKETGGTATLVPSQVGSTYYRVMQPIPFWGKRELKQDIAAAEASSLKNRSGIIRAELSEKIKTGFAQYYFFTHSQRLTQEMLNLTTSLERIAKSRYATGLVPQQDVIRAQVELTGLRRDLVTLETERHHSMARLNTLLSRNPHAPLAEPQRLRAIPSPSRLEFPVLSEQLRSKSPQLLGVEAQLLAADKNRELVLKGRYPDFAVGVGATQAGNDIKMWELMVEFNIPLQQGSRRGQEREAEKMLAAARARKEAADNQLQGEMAEYSTALEAARKVEQINSSSLLPQADATLQAAYAGYQNGKVDFATLLDAQRQLLKAKLDVLNAQVQAQSSLAQIEKLLGEDL